MQLAGGVADFQHFPLLLPARQGHAPEIAHRRAAQGPGEGGAPADQAQRSVLLIVAEPLRNAGKYTMADLLAYRLKARPVRAAASTSTLLVSTFYMVAQMIGAGALVSTLLKDYAWVSTNGAISAPRTGVKACVHSPTCRELEFKS